MGIPVCSREVPCGVVTRWDVGRLQPCRGGPGLHAWPLHPLRHKMPVRSVLSTEETGYRTGSLGKGHAWSWPVRPRQSHRPEQTHCTRCRCKCSEYRQRTRPEDATPVWTTELHFFRPGNTLSSSEQWFERELGGTIRTLAV